MHREQKNEIGTISNINRVYVQKHKYVTCIIL